MFSETTVATALCLSLFFLAPAMVGGAVAAGPVLKPAREIQGRARLGLIDVCCLLVLVQLALALVARSGSRLSYLVTLTLAVLLLMSWWWGVRALTRLGIVQSLRRGVFLLYVMPVALLWMTGLFVGLLSQLPGGALVSYGPVDVAPLWLLARGVMVIAAVVLVLWTAYRASCWVARGAASGPSERSET